MAEKKMMRLGLSMRYMGYHIAAWRHPDVPADGAVTFEYFLDNAKKAEAEKLDMIFFADGLGVRSNDDPAGSLERDMKNVELEPVTLLSAIAACTRNIGLVSTASTSYNEPFHIARKFASLDHISKGRAGWNVVTSWSQQEAWNFGRDTHLGYDERYDRAAEFVDVVTALWDSWEDDAFIRNKETGIFYDASKLHVPNHKGPHFKVRGPLNSARTPQGRPIIVQAGASDQGREIAAKHADVIYSSGFDLGQAVAYYDDVKGRLAKYGRTHDDLLIMPGITIYTGKTREAAQAKFDQLQDLIDPIIGLSLLYGAFGDLSAYDPDGPFPEVEPLGTKSIGYNIINLARKENSTLREVYKRMAAGNSGGYILGTPEEIVDHMQRWMKAGAADGFNICPPIMPGGMDDLSEFILPELRKRGLFRTEYEAQTLRGNLGLTPLVYKR